MSAPQDPSPAEREGTIEAAPTTEQPTTTQPAESDGFTAIRARMDEMAAQQQQLVELLQPAEQEEAEEPLDESLFYDEEGTLTDEGARAMVSELVAEQVREQLAPREQAQAQRERDEAFEALRDEYPELQDEKVAGAAINTAMGWAQEHAPELVNSPAFVDLIEQAYVTSKYRERVDHERSTEADRQVVLESAQGARPTDSKQEDWGKRIVEAAERLRPQI